MLGVVFGPTRFGPKAARRKDVERVVDFPVWFRAIEITFPRKIHRGTTSKTTLGTDFSARSTDFSAQTYARRKFVPLNLTAAGSPARFSRVHFPARPRMMNAPFQLLRYIKYWNQPPAEMKGLAEGAGEAD